MKSPARRSFRGSRRVATRSLRRVPHHRWRYRWPNETPWPLPSLRARRSLIEFALAELAIEFARRFEGYIQRRRRGLRKRRELISASSVRNVLQSSFEATMLHPKSGSPVDSSRRNVFIYLFAEAALRNTRQKASAL